MVHIATVLITLVTAISITDHLLDNILLGTLFNSTIAIEKYHNVVFPEEIFKSYGVNPDEPKAVKLDVSNYFKDFSNKMIKFDNLFKRIHLESVTLFEDVTSVNVFPYCISAVAFTNEKICFSDTKIRNLENLKLVNIELGRSTIHKKKINRFLYATHKFDELVISGTTDFVGYGSRDKYNTSIRDSYLVIYRDYENLGFFSLEIPILKEYYEPNDDKYVAHAVDMQLKRSHEMNVHLPVDGFYGLLKQLENEINTPSVFFPENITFDCSDFPEKDVTKTRPMSISTTNMRLNEQLNCDVINNVKFVEMGDSYNTRYAITFNKLTFTSKMSVILNKHLVLDEDVLVEIKNLHVVVVFYSAYSPIYKVQVHIKDGLNLSAEKKIDPYFYTPHFKTKLSSCIKATTLNNLQETLTIVKLKDSLLNKIPKVIYDLF
ncbi:uncharacterized protein LOC107883046 [Acyrthosiphon pisum]|uniref:Uncharacterized protein n=1 Tax=Acyrthosiphon pisum TaxID=7029 RepID=A0A8R2NLG6_ACYPI|nr:uncharacterized protein LOC107883046 [Acyrthosiphon pisum]XP_029342817.1 uncharacterized protein LOC107883046 [Acyrthosiphon pisum]|eukprot:XP_016657862.1 PREDICTED: uncharacterized protein LOC107883046 [Acyrthosiphon pisum]